jgi:hypothetical protein
MCGIVGIKGALRIDSQKKGVKMGLRITVLTSKAEPQIEGILMNLEEGD